MSNFPKKFTLTALSLCLLATTSACFTSTTNAQTTLQGAQSGLQQQTGQAQQSANTQNQAGTVQNTNQSSLLDQKTGATLGVVSTPNQVAPEVTVPPSSNLTAQISHNEKSSKKPLLIIAGSLFITAAGIITLRKTTRKSQIQPETTITEIKPEPLKAPKKHKKGSRKQRRKSS